MRINAHQPPNKRFCLCFISLGRERRTQKRRASEKRRGDWGAGLFFPVSSPFFARHSSRRSGPPTQRTILRDLSTVRLPGTGFLPLLFLFHFSLLSFLLASLIFLLFYLFCLVYCGCRSDENASKYLDPRELLMKSNYKK